jgi:hypothetical protein
MVECSSSDYGMHVMVDSLMGSNTILWFNQISMMAALVVPL